MQTRRHALTHATTPIALTATTLALLSLALGAGCDKPSTTDAPPPSVSVPTQTTSTTTATPSAGIVTVATSAAPSSAAGPTASVAPPPTHAAATGTAPAAASHSASVGTAAPPATVPPGPVQYATTSASGNHYNAVLTARTECAVGAECAGTITLTASGGYHINDEYPYRFVVDEVPGAEWLSTDGKGFGKTTGDFKKTAPTVAELGLRYRGKQAGPARLSGAYKMSVCSEANCQVETVPLSVNVIFH